MENSSKKIYQWLIKIFIVSISIAFLLEFGIYNFQHWKSYSYKEIHSAQITLGPGLQKVNHLQYKVSNNQAYIEISNINAPVKNLFIDIEPVENTNNSSLDVQLQCTDASSENYYSLNPTEIVSNVPASKFKYLQLSGSSKKIRINLLNCNNKIIKINKIRINSRIPLTVKFKRLLIIFVIALFVCLFVSNSLLYKIPLNLSHRKQLIFLYTIIAIEIISCIFIAYYTRPDWQHTTWPASNQYNELAKSLVHGHPYLEINPPKFLAKMKNPYDTTARSILSSKTSESYVTDYAYYHGKYYSYFGVLPALLFFVPHYLITGNDMPTWVPVLFCVCLFAIVCFWFVYTVAKRYFKNTSFGIFILLSLVMFLASSQITYTLASADVYVMPIVLALLLDLTGITCWLHASDNERNIQKRWLIAGAISIALVLGCRPQLAIALLFAFPIFWKEIKEKEFFSKKGLFNTLCIFIPVILIGLGIMGYNYWRFQNPFDFGATYNLTGFDMTHVNKSPSKLFLGYFCYFIQPFNVINHFPFMKTPFQIMKLTSDFQGKIINEEFLGSFFSLNPIAISVFWIFSMRKAMRSQQTYALAISSLIAALLVISVDILMVGITQRYICDFGMFIMICDIVFLFTILDKAYQGQIFRQILSVIVVFRFYVFSSIIYPYLRLEHVATQE